jgi:hypothetical protein
MQFPLDRQLSRDNEGAGSRTDGMSGEAKARGWLY